MTAKTADYIRTRFIKFILDGSFDFPINNKLSPKQIEKIAELVKISSWDIHIFIFFTRGGIEFSETSDAYYLENQKGDQYMLTDHALARFIESSFVMGKMRFTGIQWVERLDRIFKRAVHHSLSSVQTVKKILNNSCQPATYLKSEDWIFVVVEDHRGPVIKTIYRR